MHVMSAILGDVTGATLRDRHAVSFDVGARRWLDAHPRASRLFIAYMSSRACCNGARVCDVRIRVETDAAQPHMHGVNWASLGEVEGHEVMLDTRLTERMPAELRFIRRGAGPFGHLDLDLTGEQWADVLYPRSR